MAIFVASASLKILDCRQSWRNLFGTYVMCKCKTIAILFYIHSYIAKKKSHTKKKKYVFKTLEL